MTRGTTLVKSHGRMNCHAAVLCWFLGFAVVVQADTAAKVRSFQAYDSLTIKPDSVPDAQQLLDELAWQPQSFEVTAQSAEVEDSFDAMVSFVSPRPSSLSDDDRVVLEWYAARGKDCKAIKAPAVIIIHSLHPQMPIGRIIARNLAEQYNVHAFMMHLPGYGQRRTGDDGFNGGLIVPRLKQGICDARRARDAIAVLPNINLEHGIAIQGTSLGGFVATLTASLDGAFEPILLVLCGGDLYEMFMYGRFDTERVRRRFERHGFVGEQLRQLVWQIEPTRIAHRLNHAHTWLFSASADQVVPPANGQVLAETIGLDPRHHIRMFGGHYTAIIHLPMIIQSIAHSVLTHCKTSSADLEILEPKE